jgi:peptidoglycan hydrolase-like protein with peptidoglycan-binding domain
MKKLAIALLATTMLGTPAAFAGSDQNQPQHNASPTGQNAPSGNQDRQNQQNAQQPQQGMQQSAENNQSISPQEMSRSDIRQVQRALDKDGFKAGRADGRWGPETQGAVKQFQQSKQLQATGQLDQQTVADLGLDASRFSQPQNQQK